MKIPGIVLILIVGLSTNSALAQKADSVIVIYGNQKTTIPLPAFGSQTSVSYGDTSKVVEIGVWLRKPGETSPFSQLYSNDVNSVKSKTNSKWFSQLEAGYIKGFTSSHGEWTSISTSAVYGNPPLTYADTNSRTNRNGYQIRISVLEGEFYLTDNSSIISGFKFGFSQSYLQAHRYGTVSDSSGKNILSFNNNYKFRINSFQFLYQFGYSFHFNTGKIPARINVGNSMGILKTSTTTKNNDYSGSLLYASMLQPFLGMELGKIGILFSADLALPNNRYYILNDNLGGNISIAITYRFF